MFSWKSKATQQKEQKEYAAWAFPYGQKQRDSIEKLLKEIYPKENASIALVSFLTCKELYEAVINKTGPCENNVLIDKMLNEHKRYKQIIKMKDIPIYIALVIADSNIDDQCEYPAADEIRALAQELV
jgi:hypothetical protein